MAPLTFETTVTPRMVRVELAGELDVHGAALLDPELERVAASPGPTLVVIDLRGLEFVDSSGLRSVLAADALLRAAGRELSLIRGRESVQRVFAVTRMEERLPFTDAPPEGGQA